MPGEAFYESDAQYSRLVGYFPGTSYGFICLFQDAARVFEERFSRCTYFHSSGKTIEQFKTNLIFQILNLPGERRLSDAQTLGGPAKVLLLGGRHKISQISHSSPVDQSRGLSNWFQRNGGGVFLTLVGRSKELHQKRRRHEVLQPNSF